MTEPASLVDRLFRLDDRVAVVTGASSGLGDQFARTLHAAGAHVVVAARRADRLEALAADLGDRVTVVATDLSAAGEREALVEEAFAVAGHVDVLVNNAGIGTPEPAATETLDRLQEMLDVNVVALFHLCQLAGRHIEQGIERHAAEALGGKKPEVAHPITLVRKAYGI